MGRRGRALLGDLATEREAFEHPMRVALIALGLALGTAVLSLAGFGYWILACNVYEGGHRRPQECRNFGRHMHLGETYVLWP